MAGYKRGKNTYNFTQYDYNLIDNVYNNIKKDSRIIFIVRHAERGSDYGEKGGLTKNGIKQAKSLGKRLTGGNFHDTNSDIYYATQYKRTPETSFYVGYGRGHSPFHNDIKLFQKDWTKYNKITKTIDVVDPYYLLYEMGFEELNKKSTHMANKLCELTKGHPFCFITSHDHLVVPLITRVSGGLIKFTLNTRINYLSGIAVIINDKTKTREVYPVHTLRGKSMILDDSGDFKGILCSNRKSFQQ